MLNQVEMVRKELTEEVKQAHAEAQVRIALVTFHHVHNVFTQEAAIEEENEIRKHGSTSLKADFKAFNLAISPRLEALLYSGDRLASLTDSPLLPSQLSLQLVHLPSQVTSLKGD